MKKDTHPTYYPEATVSCACGASFVIPSTREHLEVEICSNCHPFYTGTDKLIDTAGRVEKFKQRMSAAKPETLSQKKAKKVAQKETRMKETKAKAVPKKKSIPKAKEEKETE